MPSFRFRALASNGRIQTGLVEAADAANAVLKIRAGGSTPIETIEVSGSAAGKRLDQSGRRALINALGELAVLLDAGLPLDRALLIGTDNIPNGPVRAAFAMLHSKVKEGKPLSRAMTEQPLTFLPIATAMAEAGEADGRLSASLSRLAETLERSESLRETIVSSMTYPAMLLGVATSVIMVMLLFVVPQFEGLFGDNLARLPLPTQVAVAASRGLKSYGLITLGIVIALGVFLRIQVSRPANRLAADRLLLRVPFVGPLVRDGQTASFARTLGSLVDGGVNLPLAMTIARRSLANQHMAAAVETVAAKLKQGGGLTAPLSATGVFPTVAMSFLRVGEETAQLGPMLLRLADVLDRSVRLTVQRLIDLATPTITVVMGLIVATLIASIMSAILGLNDLALSP